MAMSDLRDQTHKQPITADEQTFLDYHETSAWAQAMVARGLRLNPEAIGYMQSEIAARAARKKFLDEQAAKDNPDAKQAATLPENDPPDQRGPAAPGVG